MHEQFEDAQSVADALDKEITLALEAFMKARPGGTGEVASLADYIAMRYMSEKIREGTDPDSLKIIDRYYEEWKKKADRFLTAARKGNAHA